MDVSKSIDRISLNNSMSFCKMTLSQKGDSPTKSVLKPSSVAKKLTFDSASNKGGKSLEEKSENNAARGVNF